MLELKSFVQQDQVIFNLKSGTPEEIISQLVDPLVEKKIVTDKERFIQEVLNRESEITTVMENQTAFPHARSSACSRLALTVGLAKEPGIEYNGSITEKTRVFFLIAVPSFAPTAHLPLLQQLAAFAHDTERMEKFVRQKTPGLAARMLSAYKLKK